MADKFHVFAKAVRQRFEEMSKDRMFVVDSDRDTIWKTYLDAFPTGSNPVFRERTEHDCSCCKQFIRNIGGVVAIQNGAIVSVWDLNALPQPYQTVADAMSAYVKSLRIRDVFLTEQAKHGTPMSRGIINGKTIQFSHFAVEAPRQHIVPKKDLDTKRGNLRITFQVLYRGVVELKPAAVATVVDLIERNDIYRGAEFKNAVLEFQKLQARVLEDSQIGKTGLPLLWTMVDSPAARFRNTAIGTLVEDLSSGIDLERAVRSFESKVAPTTYKRTSSPITKQMVDDAMKTIRDLDLEDALQRRHARLSDVSVNSVLFVDNSVQGKMKGGVEGLLMEEVKPPPFDPKRAEEIGFDDFMAKVLPKTTSLRLYLDNGKLGNFMSLTAPVHAADDESKPLFRWGNGLAWSYDGNVTDSIKDRVKRAGGKVEDVALRVSLAWSNYDDLDLHVQTPDGDHIYYYQKQGARGGCGGYLDVDMNAGGGNTRTPVENVRWVKMPRDGIYRVHVHNYFKRESIDVGFTVEVESPFGLETFSYDKALAHKDEHAVVEISLDRGRGQVRLKAAAGITAGAASQEKWGLKTLDLVRVNSVLLSPNHWDNEAGNKHWFFVLEGCKNPEPTRGIYNEFLHPRLEKHRKVFEVIGDKFKCPVADEQLSGVGFSSTRKDRVTVVAMGRDLKKAYTIVFG